MVEVTPEMTVVLVVPGIVVMSWRPGSPGSAPAGLVWVVMATAPAIAVAAIARPAGFTYFFMRLVPPPDTYPIIG
jgi:hypothetical protein